jgi:hypothetical protein
MKRALLLLAILAGCDPIWGAHMTLRDPGNRKLEGATIAVACAVPSRYAGGNISGRTNRDGYVFVGTLGGMWPLGCNIYAAAPGYRTQRIRYADLCPSGPDHCDRVFAFELVMEPDATVAQRHIATGSFGP